MGDHAFELLASRRGPAVPVRHCKRPGCGRQLDDTARRGRPSLFCSSECRRFFGTEQRQAAARLRESLDIALAYEIDVAAAVRGNTPSAQQSAASAPTAGTTGSDDDSLEFVLRGILSELDRIDAAHDEHAGATVDSVLTAVRAVRRYGALHLPPLGGKLRRADGRS